MTNVIELREKLIVSAHLKMENCIASLSQLIGQRQAIAQLIIHKEGGCSNEELKDLWTMWHYINDDINKILGL